MSLIYNCRDYNITIYQNNVSILGIYDGLEICYPTKEDNYDKIQNFDEKDFNIKRESEENQNIRNVYKSASYNENLIYEIFEEIDDYVNKAKTINVNRFCNAINNMIAMCYKNTGYYIVSDDFYNQNMILDNIEVITNENDMIITSIGNNTNMSDIIKRNLNQNYNLGIYLLMNMIEMLSKTKNKIKLNFKYIDTKKSLTSLADLSKTISTNNLMNTIRF